MLNGQRQCFVFMVFFGHGHTLTNEKALSYIYMSSSRGALNKICVLAEAHGDVSHASNVAGRPTRYYQ